MKLLVTGGCGFIGSNFVNYYFKENPEATIVNIDAMYYCASEMNVSESVRNSDRYHLVKGNLCSYDLIANIFEADMSLRRELRSCYYLFQWRGYARIGLEYGMQFDVE